MKKINFINKIILLISLVTLTSCTFYDNASSSNSMTTSQVSNTSFQITSVSSLDTTSNTTSEDYTTNNTTQSSTTTTDSNTTSNIEQLGYYKAETLRYNVKDAQDSMGYYSLNTTGRQKLLVVPVQLRGATQWTSTMLSRLETAFFGTPEETNYWESVSSYYSKSSYEKLTLEGEVIDPIQLNYSVSQLSSYNRFSDIISDYIVPAFDQQVDNQIKQEYDQDKDSYIDATIFVYSNPYDGDAYWAWVWYLQDQNASISNPSVGNYMWASYEFMNDSGTNRIDAHTYIHETGHLLGSDDFYSNEDYDPVGDLEMQSYNVGDMGAFSKFQFGWSTPYVIDGSRDVVELTIGTSSLYSDAILINDNWNGSSLDEYLLIEYYTPTQNNQLDSENSYNGSRMYTKSGLRIYHVDARMAKLRKTYSGYSFVSYSDEINDDGYVYFPAASNLGADWTYFNDKSLFKSYKLVSLMQSDVIRKVSGARHFKNNGTASNSTLFDINETFTANDTSFTNGTNFNDGSSVGYSVTLISKNDTYATVRIEKI